MTHKISAVLVRFERLGERYAILRLRPDQNLWSHRPGQYTEIQFGEGENAFAKVYSIASASRDVLDFCIQMNDPQLLLASDEWKERHTTFQLKPAAGNFYVPPYSTPVVLIAGGSGVTPLKAIFEDRAIHEESAKTVMLYGCGDDQEIPFHSELKEVVAKDNAGERVAIRFFAEHLISEDKTRAEAGRPLDVLGEYLDFGAEYLMCGPPLFMQATRATLIKAGISPQQIHQDRY